MDDDDDTEHEDDDSTLSFSVYVETDNGKAYQGVEVIVTYPMSVQSEYTDDTGHAYFERPARGLTYSYVIGTIYVHGSDGERKVGEYLIEDGAGYSFVYEGGS
jgi:hypothetical protein